MRMTHKFSFRCHADMSTKGLGLTSVRGRVRVRVMLGLRYGKVMVRGRVR